MIDTTAAAPKGAPSGGWQRLHPLSPLLHLSKRLAIMAAILAPQAAANQGAHPVLLLAYGGVLVLTALGGIVAWAVTRWRVEDGDLRIESGVLRRDSRRVPLGRLQAIDVIRPLLGRWLGLAELRLRLAGSHHGDARLAYLREDEATALRARLLALSHGLAEETEAPPERPLVRVPIARLLTSILISGTGVGSAALVAVTVLVSIGIPAAAGALIPVLAAFVSLVWRRLNAEFDFTVAEAPDGLRLRAGMLETRAETIPYGRVQAIRIVEPLLWRPLGWCRLEVDVAGVGRRRNSEESRQVSRALLPVGSREEADGLVRRVIPGVLPTPVGPPRRARFKTPLRYHLLGAGHDAAHAVTRSGRLRRATDIVPLAKVQSLRWIQGPVQRRLGLATLHLDTAGRNIHAVLRDRDATEAAALVEELPGLCRAMRGARVTQGSEGARPIAAIMTPVITGHELSSPTR